MTSTQTVDLVALMSYQSDSALLDLLSVYQGAPVRDGLGNLRSLTDEELAFGAALKAEKKRRRL